MKNVYVSSIYVQCIKMVTKLFIMLGAWKQKKARREDFPSKFKEGIWKCVHQGTKIIITGSMGFVLLLMLFLPTFSITMHTLPGKDS